jgi:hypothetical protein
MKLSIREKLGYSLGDTASHFVWDLVGFWLLIFYTDIYGLSPALAGVIMFVGSIWDAIMDPIVGIISDRTNSRWGKFRPYLLFGSVPYAILAVLAFAYAFTQARKRIDAIEAALCVPDFASTFEIPSSAGEEEAEGMPSEEQFRAAMVDALVLTQDIFADLKSGEITKAKAYSELRELCVKARRDDLDLFAGVPDSYSSSGENTALAILLRDAAKRLK